MATPSEIQAVAGMLADLPKQCRNCKDIALVYVETGQWWWNDYPVTDFQRARGALMKAIMSARHRVEELRQDTLSPHLVRAHFHLGKVLDCCNRCPDANRDAGEAFACLVERELGKPADYLSRFQLAAGGQILERE